MVTDTDPYESDNRDYHRNIENNTTNLKVIQEDFIQQKYGHRTEKAINELISKRQKNTSKSSEK